MHERMPAAVGRPAAEVSDHALAIAPRAPPRRPPGLPLQQQAQAPGREAPVVEHRVGGQLVDLDQERRRDDHVAALHAQAAQVGGRGTGIDDVLEHLLADDHVEPALLLERGAEVELRIGEIRVLLPRLAGMVVAADLRRAQARGSRAAMWAFTAWFNATLCHCSAPDAGLGIEQPVARSRRRRQIR